MTRYNLNLSISKEDLRLLNVSQLRVVVAKAMGNSPTIPNVAWVVFSPYENNNVQWEETYGLYASTNKIQSGAVITMVSTQRLDKGGTTSIFDNSKTFQDPKPDPEVPSTSYGILNQASNYPTGLTFGLSQAAAVAGNQLGASPINAVNVLPQYPAVFTPIIELYVWLEATLSNGAVITEIKGKYTTVTYNKGVDTHNLVYDSTSGYFVSADNSASVQNVDPLSMVPVF